MTIDLVRPEKKVRCPSWTDRVLYSVGIYGGDSVRRLALDRYWSSDVKMSDHMPGERRQPRSVLLQTTCSGI